MNEKRNQALYIVFSLLTAIVFWLYVDNAQGNKITETYYDIPVEFIGETDTLPSRGLMLADGNDMTIDLRFSGPRGVITDINKGDIRVQVDLTNINAVSVYTLSYTVVMPDNINRSSITQEWASLSTVTVNIEELFTKSVPISVEIVGEVAENCIFMKERMSTAPNVLTISGREEDVDQIETARVLLNLSGENATIHKEYAYDLLDKDGQNVETGKEIILSDKRIDVIAPIYITKTLPLTVQFVEAPGSRLENIDWMLEYEEIQVAGEASNLSTKDSISLGEVDLQQLTNNTTLKMAINLPSGCVNLSGFTTTNLNISFKDLETRVFTVTNITAIGLSEGQSFGKITNSVDVLLRGPAEDLEQVTTEDIRLVVDLTEYGSNGTYYEPAVVYVDGFTEVGPVSTYTIACKITS